MMFIGDIKDSTSGKMHDLQYISGDPFTLYERHKMAESCSSLHNLAQIVRRRLTEYLAGNNLFVTAQA